MSFFSTLYDIRTPVTGLSIEAKLDFFYLEGENYEH